MPPKKKDKKDLKVKHIDVRVSELEYEKIVLKAKMTGLNNSAYLRNLGMNYPIKSTVDQLALSELIKIKGDLGRIGGLFKLWLDGENGNWGNLGSRKYENIDELVDDLIVKERELLEIAQRLLKR